MEYDDCWFTVDKTANLYKEQCIKNEYIDFSRVSSVYKLEYCLASLCDNSWYHGILYFDVNVKFDKDACDLKIQDIENKQQVDEGSEYEAEKDKEGDDAKEEEDNESVEHVENDVFLVLVPYCQIMARQLPIR